METRLGGSLWAAGLMKLEDVIGALPDETRCSLIIGAGDMTIGKLRAALVTADPTYITTSEASRRFS